jgi:hypothetical protein
MCEALGSISSPTEKKISGSHEGKESHPHVHHGLGDVRQMSHCGELKWEAAWVGTGEHTGALYLLLNPAMSQKLL